MAEPHNGNGNGHNGNGHAPEPLSAESREELSRFMEELSRFLVLTDELERRVAALSEDERAQWLDVVRSWSAPEIQLIEIDDAIVSQRQTVPTFNVPTAEGVATYRGFFGRNGDLDEFQKKQVRHLLQRAAELSDEDENAED